jgi:hypothetical protein
MMPTSTRIHFQFTADSMNGIVANLTARFSGNVHDKGVGKITASSFADSGTDPQFAADLTNRSSYFCSKNEPDQWICFDFKHQEIQLTHYTFQAHSWNNLANWMIEGSDDGMAWIEMSRRSNNEDLKKDYTVKTFDANGPGRRGRFRMFRLRQTDRNHSGKYFVNLSDFEFFGWVTGIQ